MKRAWSCHGCGEDGETDVTDMETERKDMERDGVALYTLHPTPDTDLPKTAGTSTAMGASDTSLVVS